MNSAEFDAIVIGAGPAGLTAGIYLARAKVRTLILNEGTNIFALHPLPSGEQRKKRS